MTPERAKEIWFKAHQHYLAKTYGQYVTQVEELADGRKLVTVDVGSLTPEQASEVVHQYQKYLNNNPGSRCMFMATQTHEFHV